MGEVDKDRFSYVLGHSKQELDRLRAQSQLINPITRQFLIEAGIAPGMRVLDVGSGAGDVALLVAELIGPTGQIVGIDRSSSALAVARARASERALNNLAFHEGDLSVMTFEQPFDAIVGRYVLMFQTEPASVLRKLKRLLRADGMIMFHEVDYAGVRSFPPVPIYDRCCAWVIEEEGKRGADMHMGIKLYATFLAAGLAAPTMRLHASIGGGADASDQVHLNTDIAVTLASEIERLGLATTREIEIETLAERVIEEAMRSQSVIVGRSEIGAWSRII